MFASHNNNSNENKMTPIVQMAPMQKLILPMPLPLMMAQALMLLMQIVALILIRLLLMDQRGALVRAVMVVPSLLVLH